MLYSYGQMNTLNRLTELKLLLSPPHLNSALGNNMEISTEMRNITAQWSNNPTSIYLTKIRPQGLMVIYERITSSIVKNVKALKMTSKSNNKGMVDHMLVKWATGYAWINNNYIKNWILGSIMFGPHNNPLRQAKLLCHFYKWKN